MPKPRILVVAADTQLRATLARWLINAGYGVEVAENLRRAQEAASAGGIGLAIVAPDGLGTAHAAGDLAGTVRHVVTITGQPIESDVLNDVGSALGPIAGEAARGGSDVLEFESYTLDAAGRTCVDPRGQDVTLTRAEFSMLLALARSPGRVLSRDELSQAAAGRATEPDDRSVDVLISRLRRKIETNPKSPRIIVTLPGEGYKFAVRSQVVAARSPGLAAANDQIDSFAPVAAVASTDATTDRDMATASPAGSRLPAPVAATSTVIADRRAPIASVRNIAIGAAIMALCGVAVVAFWNSSARLKPGPAAPQRVFEAAAVPLVYDLVQMQLASYPQLPGAKAIAISREGWGLSSGAASDEAAKTEAIDRCHERDKGGFCRLYALGDNVVWDGSTLPMPHAADIRTDAAPVPAMTPQDLDKTWQAIWQKPPPPFVSDYVRAVDHRALAVALTSAYHTARRTSRDEAIRIAIERCSDLARTPCLLLSVDGAWNVQVPRSHQVVAPFTVAGEAGMSEAERQRIAAVYGDKDWRALAKGRSGRWYAIAGRETEAAAVDDVLKACRAEEPECSLHAIGNWRVGDRIDDGRG